MGSSVVGSEAGNAFNFEQVTVAATSIGLTAATYAPGGGSANSALQALVTLETAEVRYRYDGTAPTAAVGHILSPGQAILLTGLPTITNFRAIRTGGSSGLISVSYERG